MKKNSFILLAFIWSFFTYGQLSEDKNYVYSTTYNVPVLDGYQSSVADDNKTQEVNYFDGLGRPIQTIVPNAGGNSEDAISYYEYDEFGRQAKQYLPYTENLSNNLGYVDNAAQSIETYYQSNFLSDFQNGINPYSETVFEASPLNTIKKQAGPGSDWKIQTDDTGHTVKLGSFINSVNDVINFDVEYTGDDYMQPNIVFKGYYDIGNLALTVVKNENWQQTDGKLNTKESYTDENGRTILSREFVMVDSAVKALNTYFVYDYFGNLVYVVTPKGAETFVITNLGSTDYNQDITYGELINGTPPFQVNAVAGNFSQTATSDLTLSFNFTLAKGRTLKTGVVTTLLTAYPDMILGYITDGNYNFKVEILNNHIVVTDINGIVIPELTTVDTSFSIPLAAEYAMEPIDEEVLEELCYQYKYDHKNRLVEKKLPGKGWEYLVYDKLNRPVLTQSATYRNDNKWLFVKYDKLSRVAYTGEYADASTRETLQVNLDSTTTDLFEERTSALFSNSGTSVYYTNNAFPLSNFNVNSIMYYDSYGYDMTGIVVPSSTPEYSQTITSETQGLVTGSKIKVLGTTQWTTTVVAYDEKARAVWTTSKNDYLQTTDEVETHLNFLGQAVENKTIHNKTSVVSNLITYDYFDYDHMGRLLKHRQKIGTNTEELISFNKYDDLGQLVQQKVGGTPSATYTATQGLQTVDYNYNVRGWLKGINDTSSLGTDLFAFTIKHNDPTTGTALYNGNISQTHWKSANDNELRSYTYTYDKLDRITRAEFKNNDDLAENDSYNLQDVVYDTNGNIVYLHRKEDGHAWMDVLNYTYVGNKLQRVEETGHTGFGHKTSLLSTDTTTQYSYDENGNLISDLNKDIVDIAYNQFNQPTHIQFSDINNYIDFVYNAGGVKQSKTVVDGSNSITTLYAGNYIYEQVSGATPTLQFIAQPQGYVTVNGGNYNYVYQYKDHLGNVRLSYTKDGSGILQIVEENHYFPFGMKHTGYNNVVSSLSNSVANRYDFNGKESLDNLAITEMDFRQYDNTLGRFNGIDLLAESGSYGITPYHFAANNPIVLSDPSGLQVKYNGYDRVFPARPPQGPGNTLFQLMDTSEHSFLWNLHHGVGFDNGIAYSNGGGALGAYGFGTGYTTEQALGMDPMSVAQGGEWITIGTYNTTSYGSSYLSIMQNAQDGSIIDGLNGMNIVKELIITAHAYQIWNPYHCQDCVDPSTIGHNLLGLTYPGGENPMTYGGKYSYSYVPKNASEYPAIGHDRRYDNLKVKGASGLFTDTRAIGADWKFVSEELFIAFNYFNPHTSIGERIDATILGIGLGLASLPKTEAAALMSLFSDISFSDYVSGWYQISNQGVNNIPTPHSH